MNEKIQPLTPEQKKMDIFEIPVHPAAEAFPMMDEEELEELAADIKANGLQQPLVVHELGGEPVLVDGRNRREACLRAGVIPDYVLLDGADPVTYIVSANINRRHMSKGQRAMVVARLLETNKATQQTASRQAGMSQPLISQARTVLHYASDLAPQVIAGHLSLENAYGEAKVRKGRSETYEARFNALKAAAPDLGELVVEEKLKLEEAEALERERAERARHSVMWTRQVC
jgi:ParB/RepB/Spo0J family partition protein